MTQPLKPNNITDLIENLNDYIVEMRATDDIETVPKELNQYMWMFFREVELSKQQLKKLAIFVADKTYRIIATLDMKDKYTWAYFAEVVSHLWDALQDRGVDTFYIIDNELRKDRFELAVELFTLTGAAVVTPYKEDGQLRYAEVEKSIKEYMAPLRVIIYIEKDDSVNYIDRVKEIAAKSEYLALFRNNAPNDEHIEVLN